MSIRVFALAIAVSACAAVAAAQSFFAAQGANRLGGTPAEFAAFIKTDSDKWGRVVIAAGIRPE
ncbi:MAG: hypothetical protein ABIS45_03520 [Burkholderiales bacterium]